MSGLTPAAPQGRLWNRFETVVGAAAARVAVRYADADVTFADLHTQASVLSDWLRVARLDPADTVCLALPSTSTFIAAVAALNRLSVTIALVPSQYKTAEYSSLQGRLGARAFLTTTAIAPTIESALPVARRVVEGAPGDLVLLFPEGPPTKPDGRKADDWRKSIAGPDGAALIKFTSGSSGTPKGIVLTESQLMAETANVVDTLGLTVDDRTHVPVPLSHSYGFDLGVLPLLLHGVAVQLRGTLVPRQVLLDLADPSTTVFLGVPSIYRAMLDVALTAPPRLDHLRFLLSCTAPLSVEVITRFYQRFGVPICQHYGSSETGAVTTHVPERVLSRPASVGRAMQRVVLRVVDESGEPVPAGREGEVVVQSLAVANGYVAAESPAFFVGDEVGRGYRTGDLGYLDDDGYLYISGRKDQLINVGGFKVYPNEVAAVLLRATEVAEAHALGVRLADGDSVVVAVVVLSSPSTEEALQRHCRAQLAEYKVPRRILIRDLLPKSESGKVILRAEDLRL